MLKSGLFRRFQASGGQVKQFLKIVPGENRLGGIQPIHPPVFQAEHPIRAPAHQIQLMEAHHHRQPLLPGQGSERFHQLKLIANVEICGGFIQYQHPGLLTQGPGQQNSLPLAVADGVRAWGGPAASM